MNKLAIIIDNSRPFYENKRLFEAINEIYSKDKNSSISLFLKNIDWPYKTVEYGIFKWIDYQNFEGSTLVTNLELLMFAKSVPNNNQINLYCNDFPFFPTIPGKKALELLTSPKLRVYCRVGYINDFMKTFGCNTKICDIKKAIIENLYNI